MLEHAGPQPELDAGRHGQLVRVQSTSTTKRRRRTVTQTRQANSDNQITSINNTTGTPWAQPATGQTYYDAAGNMTPRPSRATRPSA